MREKSTMFVNRNNIRTTSGRLSPCAVRLAIVSPPVDDRHRHRRQLEHLAQEPTCDSPLPFSCDCAERDGDGLLSSASSDALQYKAEKLKLGPLCFARLLTSVADPLDGEEQTNTASTASVRAVQQEAGNSQRGGRVRACNTSQHEKGEQRERQQEAGRSRRGGGRTGATALL